MTLLDAAMANAALSRVDYAREVVTVNLHVGFMAAAAGKLTATARATGGGRSICFCEARVEDESGKLEAQGMGTFGYREVVGAVPPAVKILKPPALRKTDGEVHLAEHVRCLDRLSGAR